MLTASSYSLLSVSKISFLLAPRRTTVPLRQLVSTSLTFDVAHYSPCMSAVLLMWHYLLTFDKEIAYFWRRRPNGVCVLFLANRYPPLIVSIYDTPWWSLSTAYTVSCFALFVDSLVLNRKSCVSIGVNFH